MITSRYFDSYELLEVAFRKATHNIVPRTFTSPNIFFEEFKHAYNSENEKKLDRTVFIGCNPKDYLPFTSVEDIVAASTIVGLYTNHNCILKEFDLEKQSQQSIRTLSGGESVRLALAKASLQIGSSDHLVIASPLSWLDQNSAAYFNKLIGKYVEQNRKVDVLYLKGENDEDSSYITSSSVKPLKFQVDLKNIVINLNNDFSFSQEKESLVEIDNFSEQLVSPCLISGKNGAGKSLLANILSHALIFWGSSSIVCEGRRDKAKVVFQDTVSQTMYRPFDVMVKSFHRLNTDFVKEIYELLVAEFKSFFSTREIDIPIISDNESNKQTLLETKLSLVAIRLSCKPTALILDEPDWGLTKVSAEAFVYSTSNVAHKLDIAVLIISHKSWWDGFINSQMNIKKSTCQNREFRISISTLVEFKNDAA